jgi:hypothetical protein
MTAAGRLPRHQGCTWGATIAYRSPGSRSLAGSGASPKVVRPAGRSTLTPAPPSACLETSREPAEKGHIQPLDRPRPFRDDLDPPYGIES